MLRMSVVKIGGGVIDNRPDLEIVLDDFARLEGRKILVHGGGAQTNRLADRLGVDQRMHGGRRITDEATLEIATMVYGGLNAKTIAALLQARGCNALSLSGPDGNVVQAARRPVGEIDFGLVGDVSGDGINTGLLGLLVENGIAPVLNAITHDGEGMLLNTNADTIAATVAAALAEAYAVDLYLLTDRSGVLLNPDDPSSTIQELAPVDCERLKSDGVISGGMTPKIDNAVAALGAGVASVHIGGVDALRADSLHTIIAQPIAREA